MKRCGAKEGDPMVQFFKKVLAFFDAPAVEGAYEACKAF